MNTIPLFKVRMNNTVNDSVCKVLNSGMITQGKKVDEFEEMLKDYFDYPYILTLNSATSGLTLAYRLLNVTNETQVISSPLTCFATNAAIMANGCKIVWADVDKNTCNIDLDDVKSKLTKDTNILSFVHWGGMPVNLDRVTELKQYYLNTFGKELHVVEDCAHAFSSMWNGKKLGTHGNIAVFSLQAIKHLTTGDGGLIFLPNEEMYNRAKLLRWFGIDRNRRSLPGTDFRLEPDIPEYGYKFHMNDINATIGIENMNEIDHYIKICVQNGEYYNSVLKNVKDISLVNSNYSGSSYWIYTLRVLNGRKQEFIDYMLVKGVVVSQVHARNDKNSCLVGTAEQTNLPNLDILEKEIVSIPVGWWVNEEDREYISNCIFEFFNGFSIVKLSEHPEYFFQYIDLMYHLNGYKTDDDVNEKLRKDAIYLLKKDDTIFASAKMFVEDKLYSKIGHIEDVVTHPDYRKNGYGKSIVEYVKELALNVNKCYKIVLSCKEENDNFYEKCGMKKTGSSFSAYL